MGKTIKLTIHETHILFPFLYSLSTALEVFWIFLSKVLLLDMGTIFPVQQQLFLGTSGDKIGSLAEEKALSSQISMCIPGAEQHKTPPPDTDHQLPHTPSLTQALEKNNTKHHCLQTLALGHKQSLLPGRAGRSSQLSVT